jgi:hypothetical protein
VRQNTIHTTRTKMNSYDMILAKNLLDVHHKKLNKIST